MSKAAFLDRDGVINRKAPGDQYITSWEEMEIFPEIPEAIARLNDAGFRVIVVTNQRCVAKGLITSTKLEAMHDRMRHYLAEVGAKIDAIYYCPHEEEPRCCCRKPQPGMLLDAARDFDINLPESWIIGDSVADVEAGRRAGCKTVLLTEKHTSASVVADLVARSLPDALKRILEE